MKSNIWKLYLIKAFRWFMLIMPVVVLFFQENGLSMFQVFLLQSVFSIVIVISEVPSGYLADIIGRKISIIIGCIFATAGFGVYSLSYGFWGFLFAEVLLGLSGSFISGADSALLYDSLIEMKCADEYKKIEGRLTAVGNFSEGIASIVGGLLALISLRTPFYFEAAITFFAIPVAFTLVEPVRHKLDNSEGNFKSILRIVKYSLHDHAEVKWLIMYSGMIGVSILTMVWFVQPYLKLVGLPLVLFGVVWGCLGRAAIFGWDFFLLRPQDRIVCRQKKNFDLIGGINGSVLLPLRCFSIVLGDSVYCYIIFSQGHKLSRPERLYKSDHHVGYSGDGAFCS